MKYKLSSVVSELPAGEDGIPQDIATKADRTARSQTDFISAGERLESGGVSPDYI